MIARQYAEALYKVISAAPPSGRDSVNFSGDPNSLRGVLPRFQKALHARGHEKLLPQIAAHYERLMEAEERLERQRKTTKESVRVRALVELYNKLVA